MLEHGCDAGMSIVVVQVSCQFGAFSLARASLARASLT